MCFRNFRISGKIVKQGELERNLSAVCHSMTHYYNFGEILKKSQVEFTSALYLTVLYFSLAFCFFQSSTFPSQSCASLLGISCILRIYSFPPFNTRNTRLARLLQYFYRLTGPLDYPHRFFAILFYCLHRLTQVALYCFIASILRLAKKQPPSFKTAHIIFFFSGYIVFIRYFLKYPYNVFTKEKECFIY